MARITISDLRSEVEFYNRQLIADGHNLFFEENGRNGYQAVDYYRVDPDGKVKGCWNVGCGTSREVIAYMRDEYYTQANKKPVKLTRAQCKRLLLLNGCDFTKDFYDSASTSYAQELELLAKLSGYRKPKNANGSTGRYFYAHLQNRVKL